MIKKQDNEFNKILKDEMRIGYQNTNNVVEDICSIIDSAQKYAYQAVNVALVKRNWLIGYRIAEEEMKGSDRADYGIELIKKLSKNLTNRYGKGFNSSNLYYFLKFYKYFPEIFHTVCGKSKILLSWSHYRLLLQVLDKNARDWYEKEAYRTNLEC